MTSALVENDAARLALLALLFVAVAIGTFLAVNFVASRRVARSRLAAATGEPMDPAAAVSGTGSLRSLEAESAWHRLIEAIESSGLSLVDTRDQALRNRLISAGFSSPYAPRAYTLIRMVLVLLLPALLFAWLWYTESRPSTIKLYMMAAAAAAAGLYLPGLFIRLRGEKRQRELVNGFPDALDLMLVCVEAGLGLEAAFARVGMEMTRSHPLLADQFGKVVLELRAGRSREDALRRMADRAGVDEIRAFATLLIQSTRLGSSVAQTLRTYAGEMREKRRMRAEERAHRIPVLISIPLVACMLPTMIGVLMLPAAIRVVRTIFPAMGAG